MTALPLFAQAIAAMNAVIAPMLGNVLVNIGGVDLPCLFSDPSVDTTLLGSGIQASQPTLVLSTQDVPAGIRGTAVVVNGVSYIVAVHQPDGFGLSTLLLERA